VRLFEIDEAYFQANRTVPSVPSDPTRYPLAGGYELFFPEVPEGVVTFNRLGMIGPDGYVSFPFGVGFPAATIGEWFAINPRGDEFAISLGYKRGITSGPHNPDRKKVAVFRLSP
jgi:hypothetical protein